jgi:DNA-binding MarR family transcriptional regulator
MVAVVDGLEAKELVERRANPDDRRARALYVTPKGRTTLAKVMQISAAHEAQVSAPLSAAERRQLIRLLQRLAAESELPMGVHPGLAGST